MIISGPSGVGKGTIVDKLLERREDVVESVSCTTRAPRDGEVDGREYFFITKEEFLRRIDEIGFLEYDAHFENYYGTPLAFVNETLKEKSVILEIDVNGGLISKKAFPEAVLVFIMPPSEEELKKRLSGRNTETQAAIEERLSRLSWELEKKSSTITSSSTTILKRR